MFLSKFSKTSKPVKATTSRYTLLSPIYQQRIPFVKSMSSMLRKPVEQGKKVETPLQDFKKDMRFSATLSIAPWMIPHDSKKEKGGEDAYFVSESGMVMGVFDGVGGWADWGVDPREYSYTLSEGCRKAVDEQFMTDPLQILNFGYQRSLSVVGTSTACVVTINGKVLSAINVGDSGFRVIRNSSLEIACASKEQQHRFNMPFQLGAESSDTPESGIKYNCTLEDGDYVILGTDGLFDNLSNDDIVSVIHSHKEQHNEEFDLTTRRRHPTQLLAEQICKEAYTVSKSETANTPFSDAAHRSSVYYRGGKQDDITVIVARYKEMHAKL